MSEEQNLFTIKQFVDRHPAFTSGGLRFQIFHADTNGLKASNAIIRIGRKILIDADRYFGWVYDQNKAS